MRVHIISVGRLKEESEKTITDRYALRFGQVGRGIGLGPLEVTELLESKAQTADLRKADEAARVVKAASSAALRIALDVPGRSYNSETFAQFIAQQRDGGAKAMAFLIGGPDGHGPDALKSAAYTLSLGPLTLPHGLARIVLAEQLYRAATILAGHPYHRA
jgi:23S rRNA (pseudouridine1915-N3)-methyltransferase